MFKLEIDLEFTNFYITIALALVAFLFICFDVHYFMRIGATALWSMFFQKSIGLFDKTTIYGICTTNDLDFVMRHMNNARFVREMDFARVQFYITTGLEQIVRKAKGHVLQTACTIRYRRVVPLFTPYRITTKLLYWDENAFYIEQRFISMKDGFIRAIVMSQQKTVAITVPEAVNKLLKDTPAVKLVPSEELVQWMNSIKISSERLHTKKTE